MIRIVIDGNPVGKGRPRATTIGGKARLYTPKKTASYEQEVKVLTHAAMVGRPPSPLPIEAEIWVMTGIPASFSKKKAMAATNGELMPTVKPDLDNVAKIILDAMNGIAYLDDRQVIDLVIRRRYSLTPGVVVYLREVLP